MDWDFHQCNNGRTQCSFTHTLTVTAVGPYANTSGAATAYTSKVDWFQEGQIRSPERMDSRCGYIIVILVALFHVFGIGDDYPVSNARGLTSALGSATGGDTITLADGDYGGFDFNNRVYGSYVTVRSANPLGARLTDVVEVHNSSYLEFDGIHIDAGINVGNSSSLRD